AQSFMRANCLKLALGGHVNRAHRQALLNQIFELVGTGRSAQLWFYNQLKASKDADPWVVDVFGGEYHTKAAWDARGNGPAISVTPERWKGFYEHLSQARECLVRAWKLEPSLPDAAERMITVAMGEGEESLETVRTWFDRAIAAKVDHF